MTDVQAGSTGQAAQAEHDVPVLPPAPAALAVPAAPPRLETFPQSMPLTLRPVGQRAALAAADCSACALHVVRFRVGVVLEASASRLGALASLSQNFMEYNTRAASAMRSRSLASVSTDRTPGLADRSSLCFPPWQHQRWASPFACCRG